MLGRIGYDHNVAASSGGMDPGPGRRKARGLRCQGHGGWSGVPRWAPGASAGVCRLCHVCRMGAVGAGCRRAPGVRLSRRLPDPGHGRRMVREGHRISPRICKVSAG
ncbi:hypothetical protein R1flu_001234 [Riccia fluitans]|uniref:Uncharacterized protein n=1 Tax=Riccia fluitans TaxID=41844 RepID=A0ABD1Y2P8_9MARC